jgi:hypothetical protein
MLVNQHISVKRIEAKHVTALANLRITFAIEIYHVSGIKTAGVDMARDKLLGSK